MHRLLLVVTLVAVFSLPPIASADPSTTRTNSDVVQLVCDDGITYAGIHNYQAGFSENFFATDDSRVFIAVSLGFPGEEPFYYVNGFTKNGRDLLTCSVDKRGTTVIVVGYWTPAGA